MITCRRSARRSPCGETACSFSPPSACSRSGRRRRHRRARRGVAGPDWSSAATSSPPTRRSCRTRRSSRRSRAGARPRRSTCSLNGRWKFHYVSKPADRPRDFFRADFDDRGWADIAVPSNWQLQGYDKPIYLNTRYPWAPDDPQPPFIPPDYNPVGSYRTTGRDPGRVGGPPRLPALRRRQQRVLPVGQRRAGRLQRGQHDGGRVRRDARTCGRGRTWSPSRSSAGRTAATSRTRTPGVSAGSTATCSSSRPPPSTSRTSRCARISTTTTATPRCSCGRGYAPSTARRRTGWRVEARLFDPDGRAVFTAPLVKEAKAILERELPSAGHERVRPPAGEGRPPPEVVRRDPGPVHAGPLARSTRTAAWSRPRARAWASARSRSGTAASS